MEEFQNVRELLAIAPIRAASHPQQVVQVSSIAAPSSSPGAGRKRRSFDGSVYVEAEGAEVLWSLEEERWGEFSSGRERSQETGFISDPKTILMS